jgi:5-oxopent-3-ene-1,2,5-tricarboxylate decarboxylase / 2-hydroxyhepta-2,4-diene-1,7-dioate isomerase
MSVFAGPRIERRRVLLDGRPQWTTPEGDRLKLDDGRFLDETQAIYLPPCEPTKIICIHLNYASRRDEIPGKTDTPCYFQKPTTALNAHRGDVFRPANCQYLNYEGEIAAIIGKVMKGVAREDVWNGIAGFAPGNDYGCQDFRDIDLGSMLRVKGMDGFCPIGPGLVRGVDIRKTALRTLKNGEVVQQASLDEMLFGVDYLVADLSRYMTLLPGDVIMTGTPAYSRPAGMGDTIEVEVDGLGRLTNRIVEIPAAAQAVGHQPTDSDEVRRIALGSDFVPLDHLRKAKA